MQWLIAHHCVIRTNSGIWLKDYQQFTQNKETTANISLLRKYGNSFGWLKSVFYCTILLGDFKYTIDKIPNN